MKRILTVLLSLLVVCSVHSYAQVRFGVTGGMNFSTSKFKELDVKAKTGWNAGLTCLVDLPLGLSLQPSLVYTQKNANVTETIAQSMGFVELPVSLQWGPDLLLFRPFVDFTPYIGYAVTNETYGDLSWAGIKDNVLNSSSWKDKERFEYGVGIGGGINVWKLQVIARYNWNFGSLYNVEGWDDLKDHISDLKTDNRNFQGLTLSVALLF